MLSAKNESSCRKSHEYSTATVPGISILIQPLVLVQNMRPNTRAQARNPHEITLKLNAKGLGTPGQITHQGDFSAANIEQLAFL